MAANEDRSSAAAPSPPAPRPAAALARPSGPPDRPPRARPSALRQPGLLGLAPFVQRRAHGVVVAHGLDRVRSLVDSSRTITSLVIESIRFRPAPMSMSVTRSAPARTATGCAAARAAGEAAGSIAATQRSIAPVLEHVRTLHLVDLPDAADGSSLADQVRHHVGDRDGLRAVATHWG